MSKSKGNGLTIDDGCVTPARESMSLFMYRERKAAKRLYFDVIPRQWTSISDFWRTTIGSAEERLANPVSHIHAAPAQGRQPGAVHDAALARHCFECEKPKRCGVLSAATGRA